jgi:hypothetical protein
MVLGRALVGVWLLAGVRLVVAVRPVVVWDGVEAWVCAGREGAALCVSAGREGAAACAGSLVLCWPQARTGTVIASRRKSGFRVIFFLIEFLIEAPIPEVRIILTAS